MALDSGREGYEKGTAIDGADSPSGAAVLACSPASSRGRQAELRERSPRLVQPRPGQREVGELGGAPPRLTLTPEGHGFALTPEQYATSRTTRKRNARLLSNPCNPPGVRLRDKELEQVVPTARESNNTLRFGEYYSHFAIEVDARKTGLRPAPKFELLANLDPRKAQR